ncbi:MAG: GrpB family protein [Candidatus Thorarchaeota archaeon]|jgi:GrpB-like predicted nucleotidyltransferase (UPF0157 family)
MVRVIEVVPYDPEWLKKYEEEANLIRSILGEELIEIHHVGSTSIPGILAKPIIDILPVVRDIGKINDFNPQFIENGYKPRGEGGLPGRRYFSKGAPYAHLRTHHIHIYQVGHEDIERHLAFRDYMIAYPKEAHVYGELKKQLAAKFPKDALAYSDGKDAFIQEKERRALEWHRSQK